MLELKIENSRIDGIYDRRYPDPVDITDGSGTFGQPVYTLKTQDITKEPKPPFVPYNSHTVPFAETAGGRLQNRAFGASLKAEEKDGGIALDLTVENDSVSACGISLPFSFLGKKNNPWQRQFAASSPYRTANGEHFLFYLTRPDGNTFAASSKMPSTATASAIRIFSADTISWGWNSCRSLTEHTESPKEQKSA